MSIFALGGILKCVQERICCVQHHPKKKKVTCDSMRPRVTKKIVVGNQGLPPNNRNC